MYQLSRYNIFFQDKQNLYVINTLSGTMTKLPNCKKEDLFGLLTDDAAVASLLCQKGIFFDDSVDEQEIAELRYYEYTNQNSFYLVIMPTFDCNFKCKYCFEKANNLSLNKEIEKGIQNFIRVRGKKIKSLYVTWFGGEPLLETTQILSLMECFKKYSRLYNFHLFQNIITNGYFLSSDVVTSFLRYGCNNFQVTLDGTEAVHDSYRHLSDGTGTYKTIIGNLRQIRDSVKSDKLKVLIRVNITKKLKNEFPEFVRFLNYEFLYDQRFSVIWRMASDWDGSITEEMKSDLCGIAGWKHYIEMLKSINLNWRGHISIVKPFGSICGCVHKNFYVFGPDGKIYRCLSNMYTEKDTAVGQLFPTGEVRLHKQVSDIWRIKQMSEKCRHCVLYPSCYSMNCPAQKIYQYKKECPYDKEILQTIVEGLTAQESLWDVLPI